MSSCVLCLKSTLENGRIGIFSDEGKQLQILAKISKHFWPFNTNHFDSVCLQCWKLVNDFHYFYTKIATAHNRLDLETKTIFVQEEDDPLPPPPPTHDLLFKSEDGDNDMEELSYNFFDSEVKVEVNDLEQLPQIEIIEDAINVNDESYSESKQTRRSLSKESNTTSAEKVIKREKILSSKPTLKDDSSSELIMEQEVKTDVNDESNINCNLVESEVESNIKRKTRGRPRKQNKNETTAEMETFDTEQCDSTLRLKAKEEDDSNHGDIKEENDCFSQILLDLSGSSSDSEDSSSDDTDSDFSIPEPPLVQYAKIPKRVVVKPKKYRKRTKPIVPVRRMTREEIEKKNAQQLEYDKIILQFFEQFSCPKCNLLVQNFGEMRQHFRASHNEDPGYMSCCGRKFFQRKILAEHIYVHWNPEHFKCKICNKLFQESRTLENHELTHTDQPQEPKEKKTFQCDKCPKTFTTNATLEYHSFSKHVPKSEFKFTCPECDKKFPTERKLKDHMKYSHDPESAIICDKCGKQVRSQTNLKRHHEIVHSDVPRPEPEPVQCDICGTWLRHLSGLKQHMKIIHEQSGGEHRCPICNKTSTNPRALRRHIYHNHECERKFKCTMCEKAFKRRQDLREHTSTHTGEVLYTCPNCPMTFFSNANMYKHRQRIHRAEWEAGRKKPVPPNIMQQAVGATAAMKMKQAIGATSAFFNSSKQH